ncbi:MAG: hypothetical protein J0I32_12610 [Sphingobacteriales bacterium]|nr:hypothetical protein [Sphingobacteriales bacterium]OJW00898.1 MAG: hypothetical protein BGO52_05460 [Sphingobacteriales bacterium 44-61]
MKFLSNPQNFRLIGLCLAMTLLLQYKPALSQNLPDSLFEKVTLSFVKNDRPENKIKDGQRQLFLYFSGYTVPDQKKFYYHYRDSLLGVVAGDTTMKAESRKKFADQIAKAGLSSQLPFHFALDELINEGDTLVSKQTISLYAGMKKENDDLKNTRQLLIYILAGAVALACLAFFLLVNKIRKTKASADAETITEMKVSETVQVTNEEPKSRKADQDKKIKKLSEDLKKLKEEKKTIETERNKLQEENKSLGKDMEDLTTKTTGLETSLSELNAQQVILTGELEKTQTEKKAQEEETAKLQEAYDKLTLVQKESDEQSKKMLEMVSKLETVMPPVLYPDNNSPLHSWFLLQEFIKGYKNKEFSVLSTPNFSKWALQEDYTYPELDITNLAGNAPIINFLIDLKKRKFTKVAPDNSYLVLVNQKITQQIFDSLKAVD